MAMTSARCDAVVGHAQDSTGAPVVRRCDNLARVELSLVGLFGEAYLCLDCARQVVAERLRRCREDDVPDERIMWRLFGKRRWWPLPLPAEEKP